MQRKLNPEISNAVRVARVLCILSMISVHVWPGAKAVLAADLSPPLHAFYIIVIDYLGRSSVPLLSTVSGVLLTISASQRSSLFGIIEKKANALILPMMTWSSLLLALTIAYSALSGDISKLPQSPLGWVNAVFALTAPPENLPLAFLRDVFVACIVGLVSISIYHRSTLLAILMLLMAIAVENAWGGILMLRPQILTFFGLGILISWGGWSNLVPSWPFVLSFLAGSVFVRHLTSLESFHDGVILAYTDRVAMMLFMWSLSISIVRKAAPVNRIVCKLEPHIFTIFCSHMVTIAFVALFARRLNIYPSSTSYLIVFLAQFPLIVFVGCAISASKRYVLSGPLFSR